MSTDELIEAARRGDQRAWMAIVAELGPQIQGYARSKGLRDTEDLLQDVMAAVAAGIHDFQGDRTNFRAWVFSIAFRRIADTHRLGYRRPERVGLDRSPDRAATDVAPEAVVLTETMVDASLEALDVLTDIEREVIVLRIIAELGTDEVATVVGKKPGTVRVIQSRAMSKLRKELQAWS
ncbi:MAG: sigma-70 family RNA polymerase sigma factor [Acidimicrobiia bacterium]|nr:sigma-70 family RNA polymerase sigma factor [Acidimicrobiia bacterium]